MPRVSNKHTLTVLNNIETTFKWNKFDVNLKLMSQRQNVKYVAVMWPKTEMKISKLWWTIVDKLWMWERLVGPSALHATVTARDERPSFIKARWVKSKTILNNNCKFVWKWWWSDKMNKISNLNLTVILFKVIENAWRQMKDCHGAKSDQ